MNECQENMILEWADQPTPGTEVRAAAGVTPPLPAAEALGEPIRAELASSAESCDLPLTFSVLDTNLIRSLLE